MGVESPRKIHSPPVPPPVSTAGGGWAVICPQHGVCPDTVWGRKPSGLSFKSRDVNPLPGAAWEAWEGSGVEDWDQAGAPLPCSSSRQRTTCPPALPPPPGLPAVVLVTGAALCLQEPPPPCQSCPQHIIGSRLQRMSWKQAESPFSAKTLPFVPGPDKPDNGGHRHPNNEASGMMEVPSGGGGRRREGASSAQDAFSLPPTTGKDDRQGEGDKGRKNQRERTRAEGGQS